MRLLSDIEQSKIVKNVIQACDNIEKLNSFGYKYLYLCSGFIAHYDINGFKDYYSKNSLIKDLIYYAKYNQWGNFKPNDKDYEYYQQKKYIYNAILGKLAALEYIAIYG